MQDSRIVFKVIMLGAQGIIYALIQVSVNHLCSFATSKAISQISIMSPLGFSLLPKMSPSMTKNKLKCKSGTL